MSRKNIVILISLLVFLIITAITIGVLFRGASQRTQKTPVPTTTFDAARGGSRLFDAARSGTQSLSNPQKQKRFEEIVRSSTNSLNSTQQQKMNALREKLPEVNEDFEMNYSPSLNHFFVLKKTPQATSRLRDFLNENEVLDVYEQGHGVIVETGLPFADAQTKVRETILEAIEDGVLEGDEEAEGEDLVKRGKTSKARVTASSQTQGKETEETKLLTDLLKILLSFNLGTTSTGSADTTAAQIGQVSSPPNLGAQNSAGYYLMPNSPTGDYVFAEGTCTAQRYGQKALVDVLYTVAQNWKAKYPDSRLRIGDLNASGHASHKWGYDVDVTTFNVKAQSKDAAAWMDHPEYGSRGRVQSMELGKMFVNTKLVDMIFFNDEEVNAVVTAHARQNNLPLTFMKYWSGHRDHFHVRLKLPQGPVSAPGC